VARLLRSSLRQVDTVARFGGEEFVVLLPHTAEEGALSAAVEAVRVHAKTGTGKVIAEFARILFGRFSQDGSYDEVLSRAGRYEEVTPKGKGSKSPSPLKVKEVLHDGRRYIVCLNEDQATKDRADREAIVAALSDKLKQGDKALVGNKGFRKYLKYGGSGFAIDEAKVKQEVKYDGKWVLTTNTALSARETALHYKQLWMVEQVFRTMKTVLTTRPIYHKCDETIRGHVFCSFLSLLLMKELAERMEGRGWKAEWADVVEDLERVKEIRIETDGKTVYLRSELKGEAGKAFQSVGVAVPPSVRILKKDDSSNA